MSVLTPQEQRVMLFIITMVALGSVIVLLKKYSPYNIADELVLERSRMQVQQTERETLLYPKENIAKLPPKPAEKPQQVKPKKPPKEHPPEPVSTKEPFEIEASKAETQETTAEPVNEVKVDDRVENEGGVKEETVEKDAIVDYINNADVNGLVKLPGIGEVLARRIIEYREKHGKFKKLEDLKNVSGIGEKKIEMIRSAF